MIVRSNLHLQPGQVITDGLDIRASDITVLGQSGSKVRGQVIVRESNVTLQDFTIETTTKGIRIENPGVSGLTCRNVTIGGGMDLLYFIASTSEHRFYDCHLSGSDRTIGLMTNTWDVEFNGCHFANNKSTAAQHGEAFSIGEPGIPTNVGGFTFVDCEFLNIQGTGVVVGNGDDWVFSRCIFWNDPASRGFLSNGSVTTWADKAWAGKIYRMSNVVVDHCTFANLTGQAGVRTWANEAGNIVSNSVFWSNDRVNFSSNFDITNNVRIFGDEDIFRDPDAGDFTPIVDLNGAGAVPFGTIPVPPPIEPPPILPPVEPPPIEPPPEPTHSHDDLWVRINTQADSIANLQARVVSLETQADHYHVLPTGITIPAEIILSEDVDTDSAIYDE